MSRYSKRDRDWTFMAWVKTQRCMWHVLGGCEGVIEADHAGRRSVGRKAPDRTCVPACSLHHRQRGDFSGPFRTWTGEEMRVALDNAIEAHQRRYSNVDNGIPF